MNAMPQGVPEKRKSAAAEGKAADFEFARDTESLSGQEETMALDKKIEVLQAQKQEGRKFIAGTTNEKMIDIAEKNENAIDAHIAELELEKQTLLGQKPN